MQTFPCRVISSASFMGAASHCININEIRLSLLTLSPGASKPSNTIFCLSSLCQMQDTQLVHMQGYGLVNIHRFSAKNPFWPNCTPEKYDGRRK